MAIIPPLNLSTCIKVENSFGEDESKLHREEIPQIDNSMIQHSDGSENFVILQNSSNDEKQVLTITGEVIEDSSLELSHPEDSSVVSANLEDSSKEANDQKLYCCDQCGKGFVRASLLRSHEKVHMQTKILSCELCPKTFTRLSSLVSHRQEHCKNPIQCHTCDMPITSYADYRVHMRKHRNDKKFKCSACPMRFVQKSHLTIHMRKHTGEKPFTCEICKTGFKQMSHLTTHLRTHTNDKPFVCDICDAAFSQTGSLKRHRRSHTGEKPFKCEKCQAVFVEKRNLKRHMLSHSGIRPFKCDQCDACFTQFIDLKRHNFSHLGIKPFKCDLCEAAFSRKNNLKWHKLTHEGDTPHRCEICNVGFRILRDLKNHQRLHNEVKPFSCDLCNASFSQSAKLKRHLVLHSGIRPHSCDKCNASFYEKSALRRHLIRHNGLKKYNCDLCNANFIEIRTLRRHKASIHNIHIDDDNKILLLRDSTSEFCKETTNVNTDLEHSSGSQLSAEESSLHPIDVSYQGPQSSTIPYAESSNLEDSKPEVSTQTIANGINEVSEHNTNDGQTLLLSAPGQPVKTGRPAHNCQNHNLHIHTIVDGEYNQTWQTWCFCETPNIPNETTSQPTNSATQMTTSNMVSNSSTYTSHSYSTPVITEVVSTGRISSSDNLHNSMLSMRENLNPRSNGVSIEQLQEKTKAHSNQSDMDHFFHEISCKTEGNYPQVSHFRAYEEATHFNNATCSSEQPIVNSNTSFTQQLTSMQFTGNISTNLPPSEKNPYPSLKNCKSEKEISSGLIEKDLEVTHILPHTVNTSTSFSQHPQIDVSQQLPRVSHISSITPDQEPNCPETHHTELHFDNSHQMPFSQIDYPSSHLSQQEQILHSKDSHGQDCQIQMHSTYEGIETKQLLHRENNLPSQIPNEYQANPSDPLVYSHPPVQVQYSLTVNNPSTGEIQIQSDSFPAKPDLLVKPPPKKRKVQKSAAKELQFKCNQCDKKFHKEAQLDLHTRQHNGEKPFICGICKQPFAHNNSLIVHMRCHTGEKPYKCVICSTGFTQKSNLRVHLRTHTGERPFKCNTCNANFSQGSHLTAHLRIHNNERPYICSTCGHAFTQRSALKRHTLKHSSIKPHKCDICSSSFLQKEDLRRHKATHTAKIRRLKNSSKNKSKNKTVENTLLLNDQPVEHQKDSVDASNDPLLLPVERVELPSPPDSRENVSDPLNTNSCDELSEKVKDQNDPQNFPIKAAQVKQENLSENDEDVTSKGLKLPSIKRPAKSRVKSQEPTRSSKRIKEAAGKRKFKDFDSDFITGDLNEIDAVEEQLIEVSRKNANRRKDPSKPDAEVVQSWCFCEIPHGPNEPHTHSNQPPSEPFEIDSSFKKSNLNKEQTIPYCAPSNENVLQLSLAPVSQTLMLDSEQSNALPQGTTLEVNRSNSHLTLTENSMILNSNQISSGSQVLNASLPIINSNNVSIEGQVIDNSNASLGETNVIDSSSLNNEDERSLYGTAQIISSQVLSGGQYYTSDGTVYIEAAEINLNNGAVMLNSSSGALYLDISSDGQLINVPIGSGTLQDSVIVTGGASDNTGAKYSYSDSSGNMEILSNAITFANNHSILELPRNMAPLRTNAVALQNSNVLPSTSVVSSEQEIPCVSNMQNDSLPNCPNFIETKAEFKPLLKSQDDKIDDPTLEAASAVPGDSKSQIIVNPPSCKVCSKVFSLKQTLRQHMEVEHPGLVYCTLCFDAFTSKEHLHAHKAKHKFSHACFDCYSSFSTKRALSKHRQKAHSSSSSTPVSKREVKPFACQDCDAKFMQCSDLKRHILGHSGIKPYKCHHCGACFTRKSSLNKHERIHTGEKPYKCKKCEQSFAYRYQFNRHFKCCSL